MIIFCTQREPQPSTPHSQRGDFVPSTLNSRVIYTVNVDLSDLDVSSVSSTGSLRGWIWCYCNNVCLHVMCLLDTVQISSDLQQKQNKSSGSLLPTPTMLKMEVETDVNAHGVVTWWSWKLLLFMKEYNNNGLYRVLIRVFTVIWEPDRLHTKVGV